MHQTVSLLTPMCYTGDAIRLSPVARHTVVKYIGHSCYQITAPDGTQIVTDPYGIYPSHPFPSLSANLVTISHDHADHNAADRINGLPSVLCSPTKHNTGMVRVDSFDSRHPEYLGVKGPNLIFRFQIGDLKLVHLGELGEPPSRRVTEAIQDADAIFFCIGFSDGLFTLKKMYHYIRRLNPRFIVPGHYSPSAEDRWYGMATIDEFIGIIDPETRITTAGEMILETGAVDGQLQPPLSIGALPDYESLMNNNKE